MVQRMMLMKQQAVVSDCCKWEGVKCNNTTGRIVELQLSDLRDYLSPEAEERDWYLNMSTFLSLTHLQALDLGYNDFQSEVEGCGQLASLENLESLNLDCNNFNNELKLEKLQVLNFRGSQMKELLSIEVMTSLKALSLSDIGINDSSILEGICSLRNLTELDLSYNQFSGYVPSCLSNLAALRFLDLSNNKFSGDIPAVVISRLMNLEYLSLSGNYFGGYFSFSSFANHSKLQAFKLIPSSSDLHVDIEEDLAVPPPFQLRILHLSRCNLNKRTGRRIPSFLFNQKELEVVDLSSNKLAGEIPTWLTENNTQLKHLDLKNNSFTGSFLLNGSPNLNLLWLDISNNMVSGKVPVNIGLLFPNLLGLNFSENSFEGNIPQSLGNLTTALSIDLSHNKFFGEVPDRITTGWVHLEFLSLSHNNLQGYFPSSFINVTCLKALYLDNNCFNGSTSGELSYSGRELSVLDISSNELQGKIPAWIGNITSMSTLDMSKIFLEGTLPDDICKLQELSFLDLSQNQLSGPLPSCSNLRSLRFIHLHKNQIIGSLSSMFFRNFNLMSLDLRDNKLSGNIPQYIGEHKKFRILLLGGNNLLGLIPLHVCNLKNLTIMDLSRNKFFGPIPSCLSNISFGRQHFDNDAFDNPDVLYTITSYILTDLSVDFLGDDQFISIEVRYSPEQEEVGFTTKSRTESYAGNILNFMSGLDLSSNQLTGEISSEFGGPSGIRSINLSHNFLQGSIPSNLSMLNQVESLDLSYNNFSGEIPLELAGLNFLSVFNVSYNTLSGRTPDKGQFANFDETNYKGNPGLCGPLLKRSCDPINNKVPRPEKNVGDHGEESDGAIDKWERVKCSNKTGRIVELHLYNLRNNVSNPGVWYLNISTFLPLKRLRVLDLSGCGQLASLKNLEWLDLGQNYFNISIIPCIAAIPALKSLSLASNWNLEGLFPVEEFNHLKQLEVLDLRSTNFQGSLSFKGT
ncbi:hypothetical protein ACH5RR_024637 [Cinchona calisaya]|uniref:Uncharacterized protein n=1 Tax=Cinchona calisaya TaxID=153742 RepID=A0ABD2Z0N8_9GENT